MWFRKPGPPPGGPDTPAKPLRCSFCNKSQADVKQLIAGPNVYICDECVDICLDILAEDRVLEKGDLPPAAQPPASPDSCSRCGRATVPIDLPRGQLICLPCLIAVRPPHRSS